MFPNRKKHFFKCNLFANKKITDLLFEKIDYLKNVFFGKALKSQIE